MVGLRDDFEIFYKLNDVFIPLGVRDWLYIESTTIELGPYFIIITQKYYYYLKSRQPFMQIYDSIFSYINYIK